ncbi:hypothetical protein [Oenococcus sp.]|uniref:hypothetical protein n=1 Tax=Oenococcus sp. TaxID=1979414 RepID=UPI0039EBFECA
MNSSDVISLISVTQADPNAIDSDGNPIGAIETSTDIYADVFSSGRDEFNAAGVNGHTASFVFKVHSFEYHDETLAVYNGKRYVIYRTSGKGDNTYLYVESKVGV